MFSPKPWFLIPLACLVLGACSEERSERPACSRDPDCPSGVCVDGSCRVSLDAEMTRLDASMDGGSGPDADTSSADRCDNGLDDDGDGEVDEGCTCELADSQRCYGGDSAHAGVGECIFGSQTCAGVEFLSWGTCEGWKAPEPSDSCDDGRDDDCDGLIDEGCVECVDGETRECSTACGRGVETCSDEAYRGCTAPVPQPEICGNGLNEDCDANIDENCEGDVCRMRVASTGNEYVPRAECLAEVEEVRTLCNAAPQCVLVGYVVGPRDGLEGTQACRDGGGDMGLRQWVCYPRADLATNDGFRPI